MSLQARASEEAVGLGVNRQSNGNGAAALRVTTDGTFPADWQDPVAAGKEQLGAFRLFMLYLTNTIVKGTMKPYKTPDKPKISSYMTGDSSGV